MCKRRTGENLVSLSIAMQQVSWQIRWRKKKKRGQLQTLLAAEHLIHLLCTSYSLFVHICCPHCITLSTFWIYLDSLGSVCSITTFCQYALSQVFLDKVNSNDKWQGKCKGRHEYSLFRRRFPWTIDQKHIFWTNWTFPDTWLAPHEQYKWVLYLFKAGEQGHRCIHFSSYNKRREWKCCQNRHWHRVLQLEET